MEFLIYFTKIPKKPIFFTGKILFDKGFAHIIQ